MPEFDHVAPVYDGTRPPPSTEELEAVVAAFAGDRTVLEAGVGTGRYALRLRDLGLSVTGIDLSIGMLSRARAKGLDRLVIGDLRSLPFADGSFDVALIVHVLQLLDEPFGAIAELARAARHRVVAVFPERRPMVSARREGFYARYRAIARERGIEMPSRPRYWENGARLTETVPPKEVRRVTVTAPALPPDAQSRWIGSFGGLAVVPAPAHRAILEQIRSEGGPLPTPSDGPRTVVVAVWEAAQRAALARNVPAPGPAPVSRRT